MEGSTSRSQENSGMTNPKVIQPAIIGGNFLNNFKPYVHKCLGLLREYFTKVSDRVLPNLVIDFYSNLKTGDLSLKSSVRGVEIGIPRDQFRRMFKPSFYGVSYTYDRPSMLKKFKLDTFILYFFMKPMDDKKFPIKVSYMKEKICVALYLITRILFTRQDNLGVVIRGYVVPLWFLTQQF